MISFRSSKKAERDDVVEEPMGFDAFELRLGDVMRGERATMGKSLLDVQRELRIKASYIAAIENCDPDAFDTPGFIAGYVRSYARYLNMDPDKAFEAFCAESGFQVAHGMSEKASVIRKPTREERLNRTEPRDMFAAPATPFVPTGEALFSRIEPGAIGSMLVLIGLIGAIGYGGYAVLQEVQRVQVTPVDQTPIVLSDLDPLAGAQAPAAPSVPSFDDPSPIAAAPRAEALDRLYRPQALDVPVMVARDAPIATLDPRTTGAFAGTGTGPAAPTAPQTPSDALARLVSGEAPDQFAANPNIPQVVEELGPNIRVVAASESWVRIRSADGNTLYEKVMQPGETWDIPVTELPPTLRTGNSGGVYFAKGAECFGPIGGRGEIANFKVDGTALAEALNLVDPGDASNGLNRMVADLRQESPDTWQVLSTKLPCQAN